MAKKVLLVDDSAGVRGSTAFTLRQNGYEVAEAGGGAQSLEKIQAEGPFDLVITDISLPDMDGNQLIRAIRQVSDDKFRPIIAMASAAEQSKINDPQLGGATAWLLKPFTPSQLMATIGGQRS